MQVFEIGDKVRIVANEYQVECVSIGDLGTVVNTETASDRGAVYVISDEGKWEGDDLYFFASELEKVDVNLFKVGDRVRIVRHPYMGLPENPTGTAVGVPPEGFRGDVEVEVDAPNLDNQRLGFKLEELEHLGPEDEITVEDRKLTREEVLEAAVIFAKAVFEEYMTQHQAKGQAGKFKARTNLGFASVMDLALAYQAD